MALVYFIIFGHLSDFGDPPIAMGSRPLYM